MKVHNIEWYYVETALNQWKDADIIIIIVKCQPLLPHGNSSFCLNIFSDILMVLSKLIGVYNLCYSLLLFNGSVIRKLYCALQIMNYLVLITAFVMLFRSYACCTTSVMQVFSIISKRIIILELVRKLWKLPLAKNT